MKKSIMLELSENSNNGFKIVVVEEKMIVGENICEHYVKLDTSKEMFIDMYNLVLEAVDIKSDIELTPAEEDLLNDTEVNHDIWIPIVFVNSEIDILGEELFIKPKHLADPKGYKKQLEKNLEAVIYTKGRTMSKITINFDYISGNEVSFAEGRDKFVYGESFTTNCLEFFQFDSLAIYDDVIVKAKGGKYISLKELLSNEDTSYTSKEIRVSHNVRKMLVAGSLEFKQREAKSDVKLDYGLLIKQRPGYEHQVGVTLIPEKLIVGKNLCDCCYTKLDINDAQVQAFIRATESIEKGSPKFNNNVDVWLQNELVNKVITYGRTEYLFNSLEKLKKDTSKMGSGFFRLPEGSGFFRLPEEEKANLKNNDAEETYINNSISKATLNTIDENLKLFRDSMLEVKLEPTNSAVIEIKDNETLDYVIGDVKAMALHTLKSKSFFMFKVGKDVYILTIDGTPFFNANVVIDLMNFVGKEVEVYYVSEFTGLPAFATSVNMVLFEQHGKKDVSLLGYPGITNIGELLNLISQKYINFTAMFNKEGATSEKEPKINLREDNSFARRVPTTNVMTPLKGYPPKAKVSPITNDSCIIVDIGAMFTFSNLSGLLEQAEHLNLEVMKINNRYNKDTQALIAYSYERLKKARHDNGSKVKFYYTPRFLEAYAKNNPYVNKIKFKTITK